MSENKHIPTTQEVVAEVMKEIQTQQNRPSFQLGVGMQFSQNKETTWEKFIKYGMIPILFTALMGIGSIIFNAYNAYKDLNIAIIKLDGKFDAMELRYDSAENRITDHENRIRSLERRKNHVLNCTMQYHLPAFVNKFPN